jgi:prepilin-type N-terminal cleavage/methylation domain-containing protein
MSRCTPPDRGTSAGFSLVEVMCALAIAAMALVALFRGLGSSQIAANYMEAHLGARIIAQSILADERQAAETLTGARAGDSGMYHWQLIVEPANIQIAGSTTSTFRLYRLSVEVSWDPRGNLKLDTLKLGR